MNRKDESAQENHLGDLEFCIRKGIGVYCIRKYLKLTNKTQTDLADFLGLTQPTISRWLNTVDAKNDLITSTSDSRHAPTLMQIIQISSFFHRSIHSMLKDVISAEQNTPLLFRPEILESVKRLAAGMDESSKGTSEQKGIDHFGIINKLQKSRYLGFFMSHDPQKGIEHFVIDTGEAVRSASVLAFTRVIGKAENIYRCNIVSPPNQKHLYVYLRQDSGKHDRGMIVFKVDNDIQGSFACGSGIMFSTERKSEEKRLQWVVILRIGENNDPLTSECSDERNAPLIQTELAARADALNVSDTLFEQGDAVKSADFIIEPILREPMPTPNGFYIDFDCLEERQDFLYEEVYGKHLKKISFDNDFRIDSR